MSDSGSPAPGYSTGHILAITSLRLQEHSWPAISLPVALASDAVTLALPTRAEDPEAGVLEAGDRDGITRLLLLVLALLSLEWIRVRTGRMP